MDIILFDIETKPYPEEKIAEELADIQAASNLKDPIKIAEDIRKKREKFVEDSALHAMRAEICAIGYRRYRVGYGKTERVEDMLVVEDEEALIKKLPSIFSNTVEKTISFNGHNFDIPFICRRALKYGINLFPYFFNDLGRVSAGKHIDLAQIWDCSKKDYISLRRIAKHLAIGEKPETSVLFYQLLEVGKREEALEYLKNDLDLTEKFAQKLGYLGDVII